MMTIRNVLFGVLLAALVGIGGLAGLAGTSASAAADGGIELAASAKEMQCLHTCMEKHGEDKKKACALDCGLAGGAGMPHGKKPDCGIQYKACNKACGKDKDCKEQCRAQRRGCV